MRHRILYAEQVWRRQRWFLVIPLFYALGTNIWFLYLTRLRFTLTNLFYLGFLLLAFVLWVGFQVNRQRNYVAVEQNGLRVNRLIRSYTIPYNLIRSVRVLPLRAVTNEVPRRSVTPIMRQLLDQPALMLRLTGEPEQLAMLAKRLNPPVGHRLLFDSTAAIPVDDAANVANELSSHVQFRAAANLGGAKRQKRRR